MLINSGTVNGLPIRAEIDIPGVDGPRHWRSSVVVCQETDVIGTPVDSFVVWSVYRQDGQTYAENGRYDITSYSRAIGIAFLRVESALALVEARAATETHP